MPVSLSSAVLRFIGEFIAALVLIGAIVFGIKSYGAHQREQGDADGYQRGLVKAQDVQIRWDADKQAWSDSLLAAHRDAETRVATLTRDNERITHDRDRLRTQLRAAVDDVGRQRDELRNQAGEFVAAAVSDAGREGDCGTRVARIGAAAQTLRELFDDSSAAYVGMAAEAEDSRAAGLECEWRYDALKRAVGAQQEPPDGQ